MYRDTDLTQKPNVTCKNRAIPGLHRDSFPGLTGQIQGRLLRQVTFTKLYCRAVMRNKLNPQINESMKWTFENNAHPDKNILDYIGQISSKVLEFFSTNLNFDPPLGYKLICIKQDCAAGPIVYWPLKPDKYEIGICVNGIFPHQIIYQLAHEMCHIYIDPRINGSFVEIICHKTAIDVLEEIGAPLTSGGQKAVNDYIFGLKIKAEETKKTIINDLKNKNVYEKIVDLQNTNTLTDREFFNIIAFKLKNMIDTTDKFGLIKHIKNSVNPNPSAKLDDLSTNIVELDLDKLIQNVSLENQDLGEIMILLKPAK